MDKPPDMSHDWFPVPLPDNLVLGERSWCYSAFCCLHYQSQRGIQVGHDSGIYHGTYFELGPQGRVQIGNYCTLVGAVIATNREIVIQDYTFIAHEVVLADSFAATPPTRPALAKMKLKTDPEPAVPTRHPAIVIGPNCWIGTRAVLLAGASLGEGVIVGAGAMVDFEVPPFSIVAGNPARVIGPVHRKTPTPDTPVSPDSNCA